MKKSLILLVLLCSCLMVQAEAFNAQIGAKINISCLSKQKIKADNFNVWGQLSYDTGDKGLWSGKTEYTHSLNGKNANGLQFSANYENEFLLSNPEISDPSFDEDWESGVYKTIYDDMTSKYLALKGNVFFNMPEVNGKLTADRIGATAEVSLKSTGFGGTVTEYDDWEKVPDMDFRLTTYTTSAKLGYIYTFDGNFANNGIVAGISELIQKVVYNTPYRSYKISTSGIFHFADKTVKIEDGSVGLQYKGSIQNTGFQAGIEYRNSYLAGPDSNGVYFSIDDLTAGVGDDSILGPAEYLNACMNSLMYSYSLETLEPIESTFPSDLGIDFLGAFHHINDTIEFDVHYINVPLGIKFGSENYIGLDRIEFLYDYEAKVEDCGFFVVLEALLHKNSVSSLTTFKIKPMRNNSKFSTDFFLSTDVTYNYNNAL